jgi:cellulose synthase/poly-beta-1,6-N-acetylglucosamine synthase-like glycosyltransferase
MTFTFIFLFFLYLLFVGLFIRGWNKSMLQKVPTNIKPEPLLSIIIPVRNEGKHLRHLLEDIRKQSYQKFEVIVVDDSSTDNTREAVLHFTRQDPKFNLLRSHGEGKKAALTMGIRSSKGEIIVTTDGDCRIEERWLVTMAKYFHQEDIKMVFGGVKIEGDSFFSTLQAHEFLSLIGTAAATLALGVPSMCNGANLAFRKTVFSEVRGYTDNFHIPSGDDEFLMRKIFQLYPRGIQFVSEPDAVVKTSSVLTLKGFVHQRIRWAGKWRHHISVSNVVLALIIFGFHLSVLLLPIGVFFEWIDIYTAISLLLLKVLTEMVFLRKIADFLKVPWQWRAFLVLQIVYSFYSVSIGIMSSFSSFEWKGRKLKSFTVNMAKR